MEGLFIILKVETTFKKVAGKVSGTSKANSGIVIPNALTLDFPRIQLIILVNRISSISLMITYIPEF